MRMSLSWEIWLNQSHRAHNVKILEWKVIHNICDILHKHNSITDLDIIHISSRYIKALPLMKFIHVVVKNHVWHFDQYSFYGYFQVYHWEQTLLFNWNLNPNMTIFSQANQSNKHILCNIASISSRLNDFKTIWIDGDIQMHMKTCSTRPQNHIWSLWFDILNFQAGLTLKSDIVCR